MRRLQQAIVVVAALTLMVLFVLGSGVTAQPLASEMAAVQSCTLLAAGSWSSGWVPIARGQTLTLHHNLGGDADDYALELLFLDTDAGGLGINRRNYGGLEVNGQWFGAHWQNLTSNSIQVYRQLNDDVADQVFVWIGFVPSSPSFDSGWISINPNQTLTVTHNLGGPVEDLSVALWFKGAARGIHQFAYGGLAVDGAQKMLGAHWQNLTSNTVEVYRHPDDTDVEQVRVVVAESDSPAYDSLQALGGWQQVAPGGRYVFEHNLNWEPHLLLVRGESYDPSGVRGIHQLFAGGNHDWLMGGRFQGANLENLTKNSVAVFRRGQDEFSPQIRVRIWVRRLVVFLPVVIGN